MSSTLTKIELAQDKKALVDLDIPPTPRFRPVATDRLPVLQIRSVRDDRWIFWLIAPLSLLLAGGATFLFIHRWIDKNLKEIYEYLS